MIAEKNLEIESVRDPVPEIGKLLFKINKDYIILKLKQRQRA